MQDVCFVSQSFGTCLAGAGQSSGMGSVPVSDPLGAVPAGQWWQCHGWLAICGHQAACTVLCDLPCCLHQKVVGARCHPRHLGRVRLCHVWLLRGKKMRCVGAEPCPKQQSKQARDAWSSTAVAQEGTFGPGATVNMAPWTCVCTGTVCTQGGPVPCACTPRTSLSPPRDILCMHHDPPGPMAPGNSPQTLLSPLNSTSTSSWEVLGAAAAPSSCPYPCLAPTPVGRAAQVFAKQHTEFACFSFYGFIFKR